jgi:DNA polymerase-1
MVDDVYGFDIETTQLSPYHDGAAILTAAIAGQGGSAVGSVLFREWGGPDALCSRIQACVANPDVLLVGHNIAAFDVPWWEKHVGPVRAKLFDTRIAYALIDEEAPSNSLDFLARKYTKYTKNEDGLNRKKLIEADPALVLKYNEQDARISAALYEPLRAELERQGLMPLFNTLSDVARVLAKMQLVGTRVDDVWVAEKSAEIEAELARVEAGLHEMIGDEINLDSPKQLGELLYNKMRMPVLNTTKKGAPSTDTATLKELKEKARLKEVREFLGLLLERRKLTKLVGTYLRPLAEEHKGTDGRVHTTFHLGRGYGDAGAGGTVTGRLSSSNPNLQNIPRDGRIKGAFAATEGLRLFSADYSQVELRVAAWYAGERTMLDAFHSGRDVHTATLADLEGVAYEYALERVKKDPEWEEKRALVKRVNFGVLYGVGPHRLVKLMRDMGITISFKRAEEIIKWWFASKKDMAQWIERVQEEAVAKKQLVTPTGRVRHLPKADWYSGEGQRALRQSVNFLVQSFSADIMLSALLLLDRMFDDVGGAQLLLTVHDSVVGEYHPDDWPEEDLSILLKDTMTNGAKADLQRRFGLDLSKLPLDVDVKLAQERWLK